MTIQIRQRNVAVTKVLRAHVERRLSLALGRFVDQVRRVTVRFSDARGPRNGKHKRCEIHVALSPRSVRVEDIDTDLFVAIDQATARVSRSVARALELRPPFG